MRVLFHRNLPMKDKVRTRKAVQWFKRQGHEVVLLEGQPGLSCTSTQPDGTGTPFIVPHGYVDKCPLYLMSIHLWLHMEQDPRQVVLEALKPDVVWTDDWVEACCWLMRHPERKNDDFDPLPVKLVMDNPEMARGLYFGEGFDQHKDYRIRRWEEMTQLAAACAAVSPSVLDTLPKEKSVMLVNQCYRPERGLRIDLARPRFEDRKPIIAHCGYVTHSRNIEQLLRVTRGKYNVALIGRVNARFENELPDHPHVKQIRGPQPYGMWPYSFHGYEGVSNLDVIAGCDIGFNGISLEHENGSVASLPNKFFEYAAARIPQVATEQPHVAYRLNKYGIGTTFDGTDEDLLRALKETLDNRPVPLTKWLQWEADHTYSKCMDEPMLKLMEILNG